MWHWSDIPPHRKHSPTDKCCSTDRDRRHGDFERSSDACSADNSRTDICPSSFAQRVDHDANDSCWQPASFRIGTALMAAVSLESGTGPHHGNTAQPGRENSQTDSRLPSPDRRSVPTADHYTCRHGMSGSLSTLHKRQKPREVPFWHTTV